MRSAFGRCPCSVSYTHLDVYKRQVLSLGLAGAPLLQLFGGHCRDGERYAALALTVLGLVCAVGWAFLTVLHFVLL